MSTPSQSITEKDSSPNAPESADTFTRSPHVRSFFWRGCQAICQLVCESMFELQIFGMENVPPTGGVLLVSNHQSYLDPVLLAVWLKRPMSYLAKSELFRNPAFAWLIRALNAFPLQQGHLLAVFPEGTRSEDGELQPIQRGVALVVRRANVPIIPVVLDGSFQAWPKGSKMFHTYPIAVMYGPALKIEGLKGEEIVALIDSTFHRMFDELRARKRHP